MQIAADREAGKRVHWVVRGVGERTTTACRTLVAEAAGGAPVELIREVPFERAVRRTWESGRESGKEWTVCLDADVLVDPSALRSLLGEALATDAATFCVQGLVLDYLIPVLRPAGIHLYRNSYAAEALACIPEPGTSARPETATNLRLIDRHRVFRQSATVIGVHDFGQAYIDLYRKGLVHAQKHADVWPLLAANWHRRAPTEPDIQAALLGAAAIPDLEPLRIDVRYGADQGATALRAAGMLPKPPLPSTEYDAGWVREQLLHFATDDELQLRRFDRFDRMTEQGRRPTSWQRLRRMARRRLGAWKRMVIKTKL